MRTTTFTFKDTGYTVNIRKISPLLLLRVRESFPAPKPPMQTVTLPDGSTIKEPNPAHPDYIEAVANHDIEMELRIRRLIVTRGVEFEWTEEMREEVQALREFWKAQFSEELPKDDKEVFISYIAIGSDKDLEELIEAVARRSQPTEGEIANAQARFQS